MRKLLLIAVLLALPGAAMAQIKTPGQIKQDIDNAVRGAIVGQNAKLTGDATAALQQFADFVTGDLSGAADLAIAIPDLQDGNGQQCFDAMSSAGKVFEANPVPTDTKQGLATTLERLRLLAMTANKVCQNPACTQVFADATGALSAIAPLKVPVPSLHDLCSLIPTVALAKPTRTLPATPPTPPSSDATIPSAQTPLPVPSPSPTK